VRRWLVTQAVLVGVVFLGSVARADSYDSAIARGVAARDQALDTGSMEHWQQAVDLFEAAAAIRLTKEAKFEFAEAAARLRLDDEAIEAYRAALALGLRGKAEERARAFIAEHEQAMSALKVEGPAGTTLYVGGRKRGVLPLGQPIVIQSGRLLVRLEPPRYREWQQTISVEPGALVSLDPELTREPEAAGPLQGPSPSEPRGAGSTRWAMPALIGGASLALAGAATIVVTSVLLPHQQQTLEDNCVVLQGGQCVATTGGRLNAAQSAADQVVLLQGLRWAGVGGAGVGVAMAVAGVWRIVTGRRDAAPAVGLEWETAKGQWGVSWRGTL
jgi:hypothetical protein